MGLDGAPPGPQNMRPAATGGSTMPEATISADCHVDLIWLPPDLFTDGDRYNGRHEQFIIQAPTRLPGRRFRFHLPRLPCPAADDQEDVLGLG